ncbi:MAG: hypothetical protein HY730_01275 [Candidatus Tectomicrobia bacterium]|uniref:Uncharacterized protein n=1 Tax=Tectimicrobiota bacterium TaxID=2528274 RepID=A0A933GJJ0_UNCTE|nr:hypothetical protein [Candidatus Tectomicrobia bacterium]
MIEYNLDKIVNENSDIVELIEKLEISEEEEVSKLKAKLMLYDGSVLWIREVRRREILDLYSYYWLRPDGTIIVGWDNAPHHKYLNGYPHHRHIGNKTETSQERDLKGVLKFIRKYLA